MSALFEIVPVRALFPTDVLAALSDGFEKPRAMDWYQWKHLDGPWGPSYGWAARDSAGIIGVRMFTPWRLRFGPTTLMAGRAMDGTTMPRARRQGVFSALVRAEMEHLRAEGSGVLFSTAVPASRAAYNKVGWSTIGEIGHSLERRSTRRAAINDHVLIDELAALIPSALGQGIQTDWDNASLRWRTDPRSGHVYRCAQLLQSDASNGVVFRVTQRRSIRILVVLHVFGALRERQVLVGSVARAHRCPLVLQAAGTGAEGKKLVRWSRGQSTLTHWSLGMSQIPFGHLDRWALELLDLEGVL